jgi:hypothetical protein
MQIRAAACAVLWLMAVLPAGPGRAQAPEAAPELKPASAFAGIADRASRSRALFGEAAKVLTSPRCLNCHPAGDHPLQGADHHVHSPPAARGPADNGAAGLHCAACHPDRNVTLLGGTANLRSIPGHPRWQLAPVDMAWEGKSVGEICRQIKDPQRNGGRDLNLLHEHLAKDDLVAWAWAPGPGRAPAPGTQDQLGALIAAWIASGAECP